MGFWAKTKKEDILMYFFITLMLLVTMCVSKDLTFLIGAGLFAIADSIDSIDDSIRVKNRKDN